MNFSLQQLIKKREYIFITLSIIVFFTFTVSYALSAIAMVLFIPFFFLDTKLNIASKVQRIKKDKIALCLVLFILIQCIGYFYSEDKALALKRVWGMFPLVFLPAILFSESIPSNDLKKSLNISKYLIVLTFLYYLIIHVFVDGRTISTFVHDTVKVKLGISQFYLTFIVLIPILVSSKSIYQRDKMLLNSLLLATSFFILLLLGNKTVLLFMLTLIIYGLVLLIKRKKYRSVLFATVFIILGSIMISQSSIVKNRMTVTVNTLDFDLETIITKNRFTETKNTLEHRILINYLAGKEIIKALPFGVGTGDYLAVLYNQYYTINFKAGISQKYNNHNQYFTEFLKTGVLGGVLFIYILFLLLLKINKEQFYYPIFLLLFVVGCFLESYLDRQHGVIIFAFIIPYFYKLD
ncbi:O-antigen ligase family protein [Algibacter sp. AS12]|uniref:O-antigen ligase family protein n=1 Tax=Algibacter sp. AS12 TaxID=3135773 RepID=UPI00398BA00C